MFWCSAVLIASAFAGSLALDGFESQYGTVEYVNVLFRHGARTPDSLAPFDPYRDMSYWPEGLGHLTKQGILQHYNLGSWLSKRYKHLLPRQKNKVNEAIEVVSTDWDRTLQSAGAEMGGMFPIGFDASVWFGLPSYPVPIHSVPPPADKLLEVTAECKRYSILVKQFQASREYNAMLDKYQSMTDHLVRYSGNRFFNLDFYMELFTTYFIEESRGLKLPDWVKEVYPNPMIEPTVLSFVVPTNTTDMKRLRGGPFIKEIINNFWNKVQGKMDPPTQNVSMYSAHDTTISAVLNSMDVFNWLPPPFATLVLFELRKKRDGERVVAVWYKNVTDAEPTLLQLPDCNEVCPLSRFEKILKPVIPDNWEEECNQIPIGVRIDAQQPEIHYDTFGRRKMQTYFKEVAKENPRAGSSPSQAAPQQTTRGRSGSGNQGRSGGGTQVVFE
uniref:acid phosphatase n=2 Tax=Lygus hesperus TaxID=30085 RepID=A0A0K8SPS6_LYGHE